MTRLSLLAILPLCLHGQPLPPGQIIDQVICNSNPSQSYALYLPSNYTPARQWSVIFAFDPRARGRMPVERFRAAAEEYGYILAGSNNSRNNDPQATAAALPAISSDVAARFSVDPNRVYLAGMSGGARVALGVALSAKSVAGVIASAAGYPDSKPRRRVSFVLYATAGSEDFNFYELSKLDQALETPHRLQVFDGGHGWPPEEVARSTVEWLEIQAMRSGLRPRDEALIASLFERRMAGIRDLTEGAALCLSLGHMVADFEGLRDVAGLRTQAAELRRQKLVKKELKLAADDLEHEEKLMIEISTLERGLDDPSTRASSLQQLRRRLTEVSRQAGSPDDSPSRRMARRVLSGLRAGAAEGRKDPQYRQLLEELRPRN